MLTTGETMAALNYPKIAPLMFGKGVDRAFREYAKTNLILRPANYIGLIRINPMNKFADIVGGRFLQGQWWDITTRGYWGAHVAKYGPRGIGLFYVRP